MRARRSLVASLAILFASTPLVGVAQESPIKMSVIAGFQNRYLGLDPIPISVVLESRRAVSGVISVEANRNDRIVEHLLEVEVPAGGKKQFDLLATPSSEIVIEFRTSDGRRLKRIKQNLLVAEGVVVGVMDQPVPVSLQAASASSKEHPMLAVSVRKEWLRFGPEALKSLSYLVVDQEAAGALGPAERKAIIDWTSTGGRLVLAGSDMSRFGWIPSAWRPSGPKAEFQADAGRLIALGQSLVDGSLDPSVWKSLIAPHPTRGSEESLNSGASDGMEVQVANLLAADARRNVNLRWLMAFLVIYVIAVGPLNYFVLRKKGRKELLWITLPALALAFSVVGLGLSSESKQTLTVKQTNVIFATAEGSIGRRLAFVATAKQTKTTVKMDSSYLAPIRPFGNYGYGYPYPGGAPTEKAKEPPSIATSSGTSIDARTDPFSGTVLGADAAPSKGYLQADLEWDGKGFFGTVTNRTPYEMSEVFLVMGFETMHAGALAPGKSAPLAYVPPKAGERQTPSQIFAGGQDGYSGTYSSGSYSSGSGSFGGPPRYVGSSSFGMGQAPVQDVRFGLISMLDRVMGASRPMGKPVVVGLTSKFRPSLQLDGNNIRPEGVSVIASPVIFSAKPGFRGPFPALAGNTALTRTIQSSVNPGGPFSTGYGGTGSGQYPMGGMAWMTLGPSSQNFFTSRLPLGLDPSKVTSLNLRAGTDASAPPTSAPTPSAPGSPPSVPPPVEFTIQVFDWVANTWVPFRFQSGSSTNKLTSQMLTSDGTVMYRIESPADRTLSLWDLGLETEVS